MDCNLLDSSAHGIFQARVLEWDAISFSNNGKRGQKEKKASEDEMAGWHHCCNGHKLGQTLGDGEEQGGLAR